MTGPAGDILVLFGITGDLARKMILPALYRLIETGELTVPVIGVALTDLDQSGLRDHVRTCVTDATPDADEQCWTSCSPGSSWWPATTASPTPSAIGRSDRRICRGGRVRRCTTWPCRRHCSAPVADGIAAAGLSERSRLVVEKPFGHDLASARALNEKAAAHFPEDRLFRVDHFLGKEPVEDLLVLRFANTLLEPLWNRSWIEPSR